MDYIYPDHPTVNHDITSSFYVDAKVTAELKYQDGSECELKMVMFPSDIDVRKSDTLAETFSLYDIETAIDRKVINNRNELAVTTDGNKTSYRHANNTGTNGADEFNVTGMAIRSVDNKITFSFATAISSGGLFGIFTEITPTAPIKKVDVERMSPEVGKTITYTAEYEMPIPGIDLIGNINTMSMEDIFDERLDFQSLTVKLDGNPLIENDDYTIIQNGQNVTVNINSKHLHRTGNIRKKFEITYITKTNNKILNDGRDINNEVKQAIDNVFAFSNKVTTRILHKKIHKFVSGTPNKELPQSVLDLLPPEF